MSLPTFTPYFSHPYEFGSRAGYDITRETPLIVANTQIFEPLNENDIKRGAVFDIYSNYSLDDNIACKTQWEEGIDQILAVEKTHHFHRSICSQLAYLRSTLQYETDINEDLLYDFLREDHKLAVDLKKNPISNQLANFEWRNKTFIFHPTGPSLNIVECSIIHKKFDFTGDITSSISSIGFHDLEACIVEISAARQIVAPNHNPLVSIRLSVPELVICMLADKNDPNVPETVIPATMATLPKSKQGSIRLFMLERLSFRSPIISTCWDIRISSTRSMANLCILTEDGAVYLWQGKDVLRLLRPPFDQTTPDPSSLPPPPKYEESFQTKKDYYQQEYENWAFTRKKVARETRIIFGGHPSTLLIFNPQYVERLDFQTSATTEQLLMKLWAPKHYRTQKGFMNLIERRIFGQLHPHELEGSKSKNQKIQESKDNDTKAEMDKKKKKKSKKSKKRKTKKENKKTGKKDKLKNESEEEQKEDSEDDDKENLEETDLPNWQTFITQNPVGEELDKDQYEDVHGVNQTRDQSKNKSSHDWISECKIMNQFLPTFQLYKNEYFRCVCQHPIIPFRFILVTSHRTFILDERYPIQPLVQWRHHLTSDFKTLSNPSTSSIAPDCPQFVNIVVPELQLKNIKTVKHKSLVIISSREFSELFTIDEGVQDFPIDTSEPRATDYDTTVSHAKQSDGSFLPTSGSFIANSQSFKDLNNPDFGSNSSMPFLPSHTDFKESLNNDIHNIIDCIIESSLSLKESLNDSKVDSKITRRTFTSSSHALDIRMPSAPGPRLLGISLRLHHSRSVDTAPEVVHKETISKMLNRTASLIGMAIIPQRWVVLEPPKLVIDPRTGLERLETVDEQILSAKKLFGNGSLLAIKLDDQGSLQAQISHFKFLDEDKEILSNLYSNATKAKKQNEFAFEDEQEESPRSYQKAQRNDHSDSSSSKSSSNYASDSEIRNEQSSSAYDSGNEPDNENDSDDYNRILDAVPARKAKRRTILGYRALNTSNPVQIKKIRKPVLHSSHHRATDMNIRDYNTMHTRKLVRSLFGPRKLSILKTQAPGFERPKHMMNRGKTKRRRRIDSDDEINELLEGGETTDQAENEADGYPSRPLQNGQMNNDEDNGTFISGKETQIKAARGSETESGEESESIKKGRAAVAKLSRISMRISNFLMRLQRGDYAEIPDGASVLKGSSDESSSSSSSEFWPWAESEDNQQNDQQAQNQDDNGNDQNSLEDENAQENQQVVPNPKKRQRNESDMENRILKKKKKKIHSDSDSEMEVDVSKVDLGPLAQNLDAQKQHQLRAVLAFALKRKRLIYKRDGRSIYRFRNRAYEVKKGLMLLKPNQLERFKQNIETPSETENEYHDNHYYDRRSDSDFNQGQNGQIDRNREDMLEYSNQLPTDSNNIENQHHLHSRMQVDSTTAIHEPEISSAQIESKVPPTIETPLKYDSNGNVLPPKNIKEFQILVTLVKRCISEFCTISRTTSEIHRHLIKSNIIHSLYFPIELLRDILAYMTSQKKLKYVPLYSIRPSHWDAGFAIPRNQPTEPPIEDPSLYFHTPRDYLDTFIVTDEQMDDGQTLLGETKVPAKEVVPNSDEAFAVTESLVMLVTDVVESLRKIERIYDPSTLEQEMKDRFFEEYIMYETEGGVQQQPSNLSNPSAPVSSTQTLESTQPIASTQILFSDSSQFARGSNNIDSSQQFSSTQPISSTQQLAPSNSFQTPFAIRSTSRLVSNDSPYPGGQSATQSSTTFLGSSRFSNLLSPSQRFSQAASVDNFAFSQNANQDSDLAATQESQIMALMQSQQTLISQQDQGNLPVVADASQIDDPRIAPEKRNAPNSEPQLMGILLRTWKESLTQGPEILAEARKAMNNRPPKRAKPLKLRQPNVEQANKNQSNSQQSNNLDSSITQQTQTYTPGFLNPNERRASSMVMGSPSLTSLPRLIVSSSQQKSSSTPSKFAKQTNTSK